MLVSRLVAVTTIVIIAASAVHSQGANPGEESGQRPASLFPDAQSAGAETAQTSAATAPSAATDAVPAVERRRAAASPEPAQPWAFTLPKPPAPASDGAATGHANEIDISALRYFASQNDLARVAAEIRLLRAEHPGWEPPQDLFSQTKNGEAEKPLWELFAKHDYAGVRAAIAEMQQNNPDWQPSSDLAGKLDLAEANDKLVQASDAQQWGAVIDIAAANKMLLTCADVDALWRTAEALARTDDEPRAVEAYRYILTTCAKPEERLATVQKASQLLKSPEELDELMRLGKRLPSGKSEFDSVRFDLIRQKVGDAAGGKAGAEPKPGRARRPGRPRARRQGPRRSAAAGLVQLCAQGLRPGRKLVQDGAAARPERQGRRGPGADAARRRQAAGGAAARRAICAAGPFEPKAHGGGRSLREPVCEVRIPCYQGILQGKLTNFDVLRRLR